MNHSVNSVLWTFAQRFVDAWQQQHGSMPQSDAYLGIPSPCTLQETDSVVIWQPVLRDVAAQFNNVEQGIGIALHQDIIAFYSGIYSGDIKARFNGEALELIQVWSDDDLPRLQENILGHLLMKKRLKQNPTVFIAAAADELDVISVCNLTGEVVKERIGTNERTVLCVDVSCFLSQLEPDVSI